jgi:hypothetical protein
MKTIARTLIILLAAGLISLGWYAYSTTDSAQTSMPERPPEFAAADDAADAEADTADQTPPPRPEGHEHHDEGFSISRVLGGMAFTVGQMTLVIALVVLARKLGNWVAVCRTKEARVDSRIRAGQA